MNANPFPPSPVRLSQTPDGDVPQSGAGPEITRRNFMKRTGGSHGGGGWRLGDFCTQQVGECQNGSQRKADRFLVASTADNPHCSISCISVADSHIQAAF